MRTLVCGACGCVAVGLMAISALLSYRFSYTLGGSELEAQAYALAAAGVDVLKGFMPFVIFLRLREGRRRAAAAAGFLFIVGVVWSFTSAMGLAAQNRMGKVGTVENRQAVFAETKRQLARIEAWQAGMTRSRAAVEVTAEIERLLATPLRSGKQTKTIGEWTEQCRRPTRGTVETCVRIGTLRQELETAQEWERLEGEGAAARTKIETLRQEGAGEQVSSDAQADFIARGIALLTGRDMGVDWVRFALVVLIGLVLEAGSSCGLYAALGSHGLPGPVVAEATKPVTDAKESREPIAASANVADYCDVRLTDRQGARLAMGQALEDYGKWCEGRGLQPLPRQRFLRELRAEGQARGWSMAGGVIHHMGIATSLRGA